MEPAEDGGYATTDEELDSDDDGGVELDLKKWLSQLDSAAAPASATTVTYKTLPRRTKPSAAVTTTTTSAAFPPTSKTENQTAIDFDSILGQLSSLDDQFNDFGDDDSLSSPSKKKPPRSSAAESSTALVARSNPTEFKCTEIADDFGDISSHLLDVISELDQLVDNNVRSESKDIRGSSSSVEVNKAAKEVNQWHVGPGQGREPPPPPPLHKPPLSTDAKRPVPEIIKNQKPSSSAVRASVRSDACSSREDVASLRSSSDSGSSSFASSRLSGRSAFENLPQVCVKVFSPDGGSKSLLVDELTSVGDLCEMLVQKSLSDRNRTWGITEQLPDLFMQRLLEDHQLVLKEIHEWPKETNNCLVFMEAPRKYEMFDKSQILDESRWEPTRLDGWVHLKTDGKKAWKKWNCVLQNGGIYYNAKGKGKTELTCVKHLNGVQVFTGVGWKKKFKAPSEFGFALKPSATHKKSDADMKYFCTDDQVTLWKWVTAIRVAKNGFQLYRNFRQSLLPPEDCSAPPGVHRSTEHIDDQRRPATKPSDGSVHRVSRLPEDLLLAHNDLLDNCSTTDASRRRGSGDSARSSVSAASESVIPSGSKMKAQIPITAQTARLLSMQPSSAVQTLPRSTSRRESQKTPSAVNANEPMHLYAEATPTATLCRRVDGRGRPDSLPDDLPPPPPELLASPAALEQPPPPSSGRRVGPPAPPRRDESTKLSFKRSNKNPAQTKNFILNLQRTIGQKCQKGAEGLVQLEMPLPPPPLFSDEPSYLDLGDLPPPPAELLEELKVMRRKSKQPPPTPVKYATLRVSSSNKTTH